MVIDLAKAWLENPPTKGRKYRRLHYPTHDDGRDIAKREEPLADEDPRTAWEVAHLPGVGTYAIDSWRIFCRDSLRGVTTGPRPIGESRAAEEELQQEWCKVLPRDKELRAYLKWRWLRLCFLWNPLNGSKIKVSEDVMSGLANGVLRSYHAFQNPWFPMSSTSRESHETSFSYAPCASDEQHG